MSVVKGRKQHEMIVVPHRPVYRAGWIGAVVVLVVGLIWMTYEVGVWRGLDLREITLTENRDIKVELLQRDKSIANLQRQLADIELGGEIDSRAAVEVGDEIEALKAQIAEQNEEIRFYKGVMLPKFSEKGLRIERLDMQSTLESSHIKYSLMLTQVVDKHEFIRGKVEIKLIGNQGEELKEISLTELTESNSATVGFRFRYFQTLEGELVIPDGFIPQQVKVSAKSTGRRKQTLERIFDWEVSE